MNIKKPELLAPGGSLEKLKMAVIYGADAVYLGGGMFSLREAAENFTIDEMIEGIEFAHNYGAKVYITANIIPRNEDINKFVPFIKEVGNMAFDGIIVADLGIFEMVKEFAPNLPIHVSTQANNVNYRSVNMWHKMGAKRVILARELSLTEIGEIRKNVPDELELEVFVHGAMCISYSGRCLLSNYMTGRDGNKGECAQPCRWKYFLMEEKRQGEYIPVYEDERGTFIYNSKDLCMIEHIPQLVEAGINSFKIEGRVKTAYYAATVTAAYRRAIDSYINDGDNYIFDQECYEELLKVSHREYSTGFYFNKPDETGQVYTNSSYIRDYDIIGLVLEYDEKTKTAKVEQRNRFFKGDTIEVIQPHTPFFSQKVSSLINEDGEEIEVAPHPQMILFIKMEKPVVKNAMLRKKR